MDMVVRAFPLAEGKDTDLDTFISSLSELKKDETDRFYAKYGVRRECWHRQKIGDADWVIVVTVLDSADAAFSTFGASTEAFDTWFKEQVAELTDVNQNETPRGPLSECIFDWSHEPKP